MVVLGQKYLYMCKSDFIRKKVVVIEYSGCIRSKVVVFGKKLLLSSTWLYSGKIGCIRAKVVVLRQKWMYSGKCGCIRAKLLFFGKKWLYSVKVVVFGQMWLYSGK